MKKKITVVSGKRKKTYTVDTTGQTITIFKLGDAARRWIPSKRHFDTFHKLLNASLADPSIPLVFHWGVTVEQIKLGDYPLTPSNEEICTE